MISWMGQKTWVAVMMMMIYWMTRNTHAYSMPLDHWMARKGNATFQNNNVPVHLPYSNSGYHTFARFFFFFNLKHSSVLGKACQFYESFLFVGSENCQIRVVLWPVLARSDEKIIWGRWGVNMSKYVIQDTFEQQLCFGNSSCMLEEK